MLIGIPTETQHDERRICITPAGVHALIKEKHRVIVQADAGRLSGFSAEDFAKAGGEVVFNAEEVLHRAELLVKVQPLTPAEAENLREGSIVFSAFELGLANKAAVQMMSQKDITAIGLDLIQRQDGQHPVITAMSEIAGAMVPHVAARYLESPAGGRGILLGGIAGQPPANVVIVGAGKLGSTAALNLVGVGAHVIAMDTNIDQLRRIERLSYKIVSTAIANSYNIERYTRFADVLVGAVFIRGQRTPHIITEENVKNMRPGSLIMDISIDQGGCVETSRPTTLRDPVFQKHGITHYCVPNMPAAVARTASHAFNNVVMPYVLHAASGPEKSPWKTSFALRSGTYIFNGTCTNQNIASLFSLDYSELDALI